MLKENNAQFAGNCWGNDLVPHLQSRGEQDAADDHGDEEKDGVHEPGGGGVLAGGAGGAAEGAGRGAAAAGQGTHGQEGPHGGGLKTKLTLGNFPALHFSFFFVQHHSK